MDLYRNVKRLREIYRNKRSYVGAALYWSGVAWLFQKLVKPHGAVILMYHSVAHDDVARYIDPPNHLCSSEFERQMAFLSRHRKVVALSDLLVMMESGVEPEAGTVCITFDDGYLDNLTVAAPILQKYQLPATLYLPTSYIARGETHWADLVHQMFLLRSRDQLTIAHLGLSADLSDARQKRIAYKVLHKNLLPAQYGLRQALLDEVRGQLLPSGDVPRLTMTWDDVRSLGEHYPQFVVGGHSRNHIDLSSHGGQYASEEIEGCRVDIQSELGQWPAHFSFPYARWKPETRALAMQAGWSSAVGQGEGVRIGSQSDRYVMPRLSAPGSMTGLRFCTGGAYPGVFKLVGR